jgi:hypothetical protein
MRLRPLRPSIKGLSSGFWYDPSVLALNRPRGHFDRATPPVFWTFLIEEDSQTSSGTQSHAQWRLSDGQDSRASPTRILLEATSQDRE